MIIKITRSILLFILHPFFFCLNKFIWVIEKGILEQSNKIDKRWLSSWFGSLWNTSAYFAVDMEATNLRDKPTPRSPHQDNKNTPTHSPKPILWYVGHFPKSKNWCLQPCRIWHYCPTPTNVHNFVHQKNMH